MIPALEALCNGVDMIAAVKGAKPFAHKQIVSFNQVQYHNTTTLRASETSPRVCLRNARDDFCTRPTKVR